MSSHRRILPLILILVFLLFFIFESCSSDEFKMSCLESREILESAKKELKFLMSKMFLMKAK